MAGKSTEEQARLIPEDHGEKYDSMWGAADADKVSKTVAHVLPTLHLNTDEAWDEDRDNQDLESGGVSRYCGEWSPTSFMHSIRYLWCGYKREEDIENCSENVKHFYIEQNALLEEYVACSLGHDLLCEDERKFVQKCASTVLGELEEHSAENERRIQWALVLSNSCNVLLLFAQLYAFMNSMSLAILASFIDATLDFISGLMIYFTWRMKHCRDKYSYPVGQSRMEPLGVIGMACLMTSATIVTLQESITTLVGGEENLNFSGLTPTVIAVVIFALITKLCLYLYCRGNDDMSVKSMAMDHLNDVVANSISLTTALIAQRFLWWLDPVGGIVISLLIINNWVNHTLEHVQNLLGKVADRDVLSLVTFIACNHHPKVNKVDTVRAYHVGNGVFVECDIVLSSDMRLWEAHDIGESLQNRIERLENVDRAFVHLDTEAEHSPDIEHKVI